MRRMAPLAKLCRAKSSRFHAANTVVLMLVSIDRAVLHSALKAKGVSTSPFLMKNVICCQTTRKNVHAIVIFQAPSQAPGTLHFLFSWSILCVQKVGDLFYICKSAPSILYLFFFVLSLIKKSLKTSFRYKESCYFRRLDMWK